MATVLQSPVFKTLDAETTKGPYWWSTTGADLSNMLHEANYPEEVQRLFLSYYRDTICPILGPKPDDSSLKSGVGWDGNPLEYSFELKDNTTKKQAVRFVVDLSPLHGTANKDNPLSMEATQEVVNALASNTPGFNDSWSNSCKNYFVYAHLPLAEQKALIEKSGQSTSVILGFDIYPRIAENGRLPVMAKVYYPPCYAAAARGITRWGAVKECIQQLPQVEEHPNILKSMGVIDSYLADKPKEWQMGTRYLATDLIAPGKARLKVYQRIWGESFDEIWDYYTLGGRLGALEEDKEKFRDLMNLLSGDMYSGRKQDLSEMKQERFSSATKKLTAIYFSMSAENPLPAPKLCIYPSNFAPDDETIAKGLDAWLSKYKWSEGDSKTMEDRVKSVFNHRKLAERTGIFTFIGIGRKEDPTNKSLGIQVYLTPELYEAPRDI